jgi:hypothetical protein
MANGITVVDSFITEKEINSYLNTLSQKYLTNNEFILSGTNNGIVSAGVTSIAPYANLSNRYYPSVATLPSVESNLKTANQLGGYFVPSNLGASIYLTKNITYSLNISQIKNGLSYHYIDPSKYNKGRGLTQKDQSNIIDHTIDINWVKSTNTSDYFDGNVINADTYQKFIPYQSVYESTKADSNGVINARYDFEFWTGTQKQTWAAVNSATQLNQLGYFDLNARIQNLLYTPDSALYSWNTDVFGNQYALYKPISVPHSLYQDSIATGNLWVKTIDSTIYTGPSALNLVYKNHINNTTIYNQLINNEIVNFEVFFDTLIIQLSNTVLYEKITFDYNTYNISSSLQNFLPLELGTSSTLPISTVGFRNGIGLLTNSLSGAQVYYGGNWYDSNAKTITVCTLLSATFYGKANSLIDVQGLSSIIVPVLYKLDLNNPREREKIYPTNNTSPNEFIEYVYPAGKVCYMEPPVFCYNEDTNKYSTAFVAFFSGGQQLNLINYKVTPK